jgi:hypothetical protein
MADKAIETSTPPTPPVAVKAEKEQSAKVVEAAEIVEAQVSFFEQNGYTFCSKCNQRLYTDENQQPICSANDPACPMAT